MSEDHGEIDDGLGDRSTKSVWDNKEKTFEVKKDMCLSTVVVLSIITLIVFLSLQGLQIIIARTLMGRKQEQEEAESNQADKQKKEKVTQNRKEAKRAKEDLETILNIMDRRKISSRIGSSIGESFRNAHAIN